MERSDQNRPNGAHADWTRRVLAAVALGVAVTAVWVVCFCAGILVAAVVSDACVGADKFLSGLWLVVLWPVVMVIFTLLAMYLVLRQKGRRTILRTICLGFLVGAGWFLVYFPLLRLECAYWHP